MALIPMPIGGIRSVRWSLNQPAAVQRSEFTGKTKVLQQAGARWSATVEVTPRKVAALHPWRSFFGKLRGPVNVFRLPATEGDQLACPVATMTMYADGRTGNMLIQSRDLTNAAFTRTGTTTAITGFMDFEGVPTATILSENTANSQHAISGVYASGFGARVSFSIYARYIGGRRYVQLFADNGAAVAVFDLVTGLVVSATGADTRIVDAGDGWYRIAIIFTATTTSGPAGFLMGSGPTTFSYLGTGSTVAIDKPQVQVGPPSAWVSTSTVTATSPRAFVVATPTANLTYLRAGQMITLKNRLYELTADIASDSIGVAAVEVAPDLGALTNTNETIECQRPYALVRLGDGQSGWTAEPGFYTPGAFSVEESF